MNGAVAYFLVKSMDKSKAKGTKEGTKEEGAKVEETNALETNAEEKVLDLYQSPKRDNLCVQCGQQLNWCVCHLND